MANGPRFTSFYALALAASLLPVLLSALLVWQVRTSDYESAGKSALNAATAIASDFETSFAQFDALLKSIGRQAIESGPEGRESLEKRLQAELADYPFVARAFIADSTAATVRASACSACGNDWPTFTAVWKSKPDGARGRR